LQRSPEVEQRRPNIDGVSMRVRAIRRSRIVNLEDRLDALEQTIGNASSAGARSRFQGDPDALEALLSLGYGRREAAALLAATPDGNTAERVAAALKVAGASR
jgi:Holliday junction resolvasome RuvABC DNA-binding subunit